MANQTELTLYDCWIILQKHTALVVGVTVVGIVLAALFLFFVPTVYRGEAVLQMGAPAGYGKTLPTAKEVVDLVGKITREKIPVILPENRRLVKSIELAELKGSADKIKVTVESPKSEVINASVDELTAYLNRSPSLERSVSQVRTLLTKQKEELDTVIQQSTELSKSLDKMLKEGRLLPVGFNPVEVSRKISDFKVERLAIEQSLAILAGVKIADRAVIVRERRSSLFIPLAGVASLFLAVVLAFSKEFFDRAKGDQRCTEPD